MTKPERASLKSNQLSKANVMIGGGKKRNFLLPDHQRFSWRALMAQLCSTAEKSGGGWGERADTERRWGSENDPSSTDFNHKVGLLMFSVFGVLSMKSADFVCMAPVRCSLPGVIGPFQHSVVLCFSNRVGLNLGPRSESSFRSWSVRLFSNIEQPVQLLSGSGEAADCGAFF